MEMLICLSLVLVFLGGSYKLGTVLWERLKGRSKNYERHIASIEVLDYFTKTCLENEREDDELVAMLQWWKSNLDEKR